MNLPPEAPRFYTTLALDASTELTLEESVSRHISGALRLKPGADLILFNGRGGEYHATLVSTGKRAVTVSVLSQHDIEREPPLPVTLGLGISRGERMDFAIQKSTELGVTHIVPLVTERTEVRLSGERMDKKLRHWSQVAISACEQCGRNRPPTVETPLKLSEWLTRDHPGLRLVLHHRTDSGLSGLPAPEQVSLLIGPEGGLSNDEIAAAQNAGFQALGLGPRVLRTETAPVAALSILQFHWGDMQ